MEGMQDYIANVVPGEGAVARWESGVLLVGGDRTAGLDLIARVHDQLGLEPDAGALIDALSGQGPIVDGQVDLTAAIRTAAGVQVIVRGGAQARTETNELITAGANAAVRDLERPMALWLGLGDPPTVQGHPAKNLRLGVVNGAGVVVYLAPEPQTGDGPSSLTDDRGVSVPPSAPTLAPPSHPTPAHPTPSHPTPPAPAVPAAPSPAPPSPPVQSPVPAQAETGPSETGGSNQPEAAALPVPQQDFKAIDWNDATPVEDRAPLAVQDSTVDGAGESLASTGEQVLGIRCSREHFNNPKAGYCQVCGISMVHLTHRLEPGPRPTLGFMVFADGATYAVDRQYLIGRSPQPRPGGGLTSLQTQDVTQSVSREHAELRLDGWDAYYVDLGSTNGSFLWDAAGRRWDPIQPNTPVELTSGAMVSVGRMTFVFEAASRAIESP